MGKSYEKSVVENIYCMFRMPNTIAMILCDKCNKWYRKGCEGVGLHINMKDKKWHCTTCKCLHLTTYYTNDMNSIIPNVYISFILGVGRVVSLLATDYLVGNWD